MIEAICFEKDHRYLASEHGGYTCQSCRDNITNTEFEKRSNANTWIDGKAPLRFCEICQTWHVPQDFDINSRMEIRFKGRGIEIVDMKNGTFCYETDRDQFGYVTASGWCDAVEKIKACV